MKALILLLLAFVILSSEVFAEDTLFINASLNSFGGSIDPNEGLFAGSSLRYNISIHNPGSKPVEASFITSIENPAKELIDTYAVYETIAPNATLMLSSQRPDGSWRLIYASVPGIYKLTISSNHSDVYFYENSAFGWRNTTIIPFFYEIKTPGEKRLNDLNINLTQQSIQLAKDGKILNEKMLKFTAAMFVVSILTLCAMITDPKTRPWLFVLASVILFFALFKWYLL